MRIRTHKYPQMIDKVFCLIIWVPISSHPTIPTTQKTLLLLMKVLGLKEIQKICQSKKIKLEVQKDLNSIKASLDPIQVFQKIWYPKNKKTYKFETYNFFVREKKNISKTLTLMLMFSKNISFTGQWLSIIYFSVSTDISFFIFIRKFTIMMYFLKNRSSSISIIFVFYWHQMNRFCIIDYFIKRKMTPIFFTYDL